VKIVPLVHFLFLPQVAAKRALLVSAAKVEAQTAQLAGLESIVTRNLHAHHVPPDSTTVRPLPHLASAFRLARKLTVHAPASHLASETSITTALKTRAQPAQASAKVSTITQHAPVVLVITSIVIAFALIVSLVLIARVLVPITLTFAQLEDSGATLLR